jgi:hypothetical protein
VNETPRKERPFAALGTLNVPKEVDPSKNWMVALEETFVKTAPNPFVVAGVEVPGTKRATSVMVLPRGVKSLGGLNV